MSLTSFACFCAMPFRLLLRGGQGLNDGEDHGVDEIGSIYSPGSYTEYCKMREIS